MRKGRSSARAVAVGGHDELVVAALAGVKLDGLVGEVLRRGNGSVEGRQSQWALRRATLVAPGGSGCGGGGLTHRVHGFRDLLLAVLRLGLGGCGGGGRRVPPDRTGEPFALRLDAAPEHPCAKGGNERPR